jgi:hypothetical protein
MDNRIAELERPEAELPVEQAETAGGGFAINFRVGESLWVPEQPRQFEPNLGTLELSAKSMYKEQ